MKIKKAKGARGSGKNFNYYADGISYYKIMIKHDDTDKALNELGEIWGGEKFRL